jgi:L-rhamnose mutarotase
MHDDSLERAILIQRLEPDGIDGYIEAHKSVPEDIVERMEESGVEEFRLFVGENLSIGYIAAEDIGRFEEEYAEDPACIAWEEKLAEYKRTGVDTEEGDFPALEQIWALEEV